MKDNRKAENKKSKKHESISKPDKKNKQIPNIKEVPNNCKHLVNADDVMYVVPGNGSCGPNCASALLFGDEVFGPKLRPESQKAGILGILDTENIFQIIQIEEHFVKITGNFMQFIRIPQKSWMSSVFPKFIYILHHI